MNNGNAPGEDEKHQGSPVPGFRRLILIVGLLFLPACLFFGYGTDNDTYGALDAGRYTWLNHYPYTSRNPGYWTYEAILFVLRAAGGHVATNLATLAVSLVLVWRFLVISTRLGARFPRLVVACLVTTPVFFIASTSTVDYLWSLLGLVIFAEWLIAGRFWLAVLPAAFAFAIRGANGLLVAGAIAGAISVDLSISRRPTKRTLQVFAVGVAAALLGGLPFVESYRLAGHTLAFTAAMAGPDTMWTLPLRIGRFCYKALYLFGPLGWIVLAAAFAARSAPRHVTTTAHEYRRRAVPVFAGIVIFNIILFFAWPIEISYLLPGEFFLLLLLSICVLAKQRWITAAFTGVTALSCFLYLQLVVPNVPGRSTGARVRPGIKLGEALDDLRKRIPLRDCDTHECWLTHNIEDMPPPPPPLSPPPR